MSYPSYQKNSFYNQPKQPLTKRNDILDRSSFHQNIENQFNIQRPYNVCNTEQSDYGYGTPEKDFNNRYQSYQREEEPKCQNENDRNVDRYKSYISSTQRLTEINSQNYLNYIMNQKKNAHSRYLSQSHQLTTPINDSYPQQKSSPISSLYNRSRLNEITNPDMYYKQSNMDYIKYREQQRNYLNSNYDLMVNNGNYKKKLDVNPYNVNSSSTSLGESMLVHNTILNPLPNYTYNKYFDEEFKRQNGKKKCNSSFIV